MEAEIQYREFYDVPRIFLVRHKAQLFLFESPFDEAADEYSAQYEIYLMPELSNKDLAGSWVELRGRASRRLGSLPVNEVQFDDTRRRTIETSVLNSLLGARYNGRRNLDTRIPRSLGAIDSVPQGLADHRAAHGGP